MWKSVIVATATLAIAGSSIVYAQQHAGDSGRPGNDGERRFEHRHRPSVQDLAAFTDARIAALRAGLELTPDQAKNWPAYEQALREVDSCASSKFSSTGPGPINRTRRRPPHRSTGWRSAPRA